MPKRRHIAKMSEIHIGSKGTEVVIPAGYLNRAKKRKMKRKGIKYIMQ